MRLASFRRISLFCLVAASVSTGEPLRMAHVFQDGMVLQSGMPVPLWGWAAPGEAVEVVFAGQRHHAIADSRGAWKVALDPPAVNAHGEILRVTRGAETLELRDVLVGEVWVCAGQSNMGWTLELTLSRYPQLAERMGNPGVPTVRFIRYGRHHSQTPLKDMEPGPFGGAQWTQLTSESAGDSMAVPFFFARRLVEDVEVPVGLVQIAVGGTSQVAWSPREVIDQVASGHDADYDFSFFERAAVEQGRLPHQFPSVIANARMHPLKPLAFRGMIWHQGEGGPTELHAERLQALVAHWRDGFGHDFAFVWGTLPRRTQHTPPIAPRLKHGRAHLNLQFLRAQQAFGFEGRTVLCDFYDLGNFQAHWGRKDCTGERMALAALDRVYERSNVFTGPQLVETQTLPGEMRMSFVHTGSGLEYAPVFDGITGFVLVAGETIEWIAPDTVERDCLVFRHPMITENAVIYYGYAHNAHETLFNREGFPASMFPAQPSQELFCERRGDYLFGGRLTRLDEIPLVTFAPGVETPSTVHLNLTHVRRQVYQFTVVTWPERKAGSIRVQLYQPREWSGVAVRQGSQTLTPDAGSTHSGGARTVEIEVDYNSSPYIVYNPEKQDEAFQAVDLGRF